MVTLSSGPQSAATKSELLWAASDANLSSAKLMHPYAPQFRLAFCIWYVTKSISNKGRTAFNLQEIVMFYYICNAHKILYVQSLPIF